MYIITNRSYQKEAAKMFNTLFVHKKAADQRLGREIRGVEWQINKLGPEYRKEQNKMILGCEVLPFKGFII